MDTKGFVEKVKEHKTKILLGLLGVVGTVGVVVLAQAMTKSEDVIEDGDEVMLLDYADEELRTTEEEPTEE